MADPIATETQPSLRRGLSALGATTLVAGAVIGSGIYLSPSIVAREVGSPGFLFDTTAAALRLVFAGVLERLPDLQLVIGHLGGTIPYIVERADRGFEECRAHIGQPPSHFGRRVYYDTVNFHPGRGAG